MFCSTLNCQFAPPGIFLSIKLFLHSSFTSTSGKIWWTNFLIWWGNFLIWWTNFLSGGLIFSFGHVEGRLIFSFGLVAGRLIFLFGGLIFLFGLQEVVLFLFDLVAYGLIFLSDS